MNQRLVEEQYLGKLIREEQQAMERNYVLQGGMAGKKRGNVPVGGGQYVMESEKPVERNIRSWNGTGHREAAAGHGGEAAVSKEEITEDKGR